MGLDKNSVIVEDGPGAWSHDLLVIRASESEIKSVFDLISVGAGLVLCVDVPHSYITYTSLYCSYLLSVYYFLSELQCGRIEF